MKYDGVILYGPPASGKDTVTAELCKLSAAYAYFERLKAGEGRSTGYRRVSEERLADLRARGLILYENSRYGATYAVDSVGLDKLLKAGRVPVVHMGQMAGVNALRERGAHWLDVLLWCSKDVAEERLRERGNADIDERLAAWQATLVDVGSFGEPQFTLSVRTDVVMPDTTASIIHAAMMGEQSIALGAEGPYDRDR